MLPRPTARRGSILPGNPGMATGGTGDVLTGMLSGLIAQYGAACSRRFASECIFTGLRATLPMRIRASAADGHGSDPLNPARLSAVFCRVRPWLAAKSLRIPRKRPSQRAGNLGAQLKPPVAGFVSGDLGAGKTTLTKGIVSGAGRGARRRSYEPNFHAGAQIRRMARASIMWTSIASAILTIWRRLGWRMCSPSRRGACRVAGETFIAHGLAGDTDSIWSMWRRTREGLKFETMLEFSRAASRL